MVPDVHTSSSSNQYRKLIDTLRIAKHRDPGNFFQLLSKNIPICHRGRNCLRLYALGRRGEAVEPSGRRVTAQGQRTGLHNESDMATAPKLSLAQLRHLPVEQQAFLALHQIPKIVRDYRRGFPVLGQGRWGVTGGVELEDRWGRDGRARPLAS
jgi:hypothetical protein